MAQLINVKLSRFDSSPWGFRLQGGKDFGAPLLIQKVNGGSLAEKAGLQAGDAVIKVNDVEVFNLRHKEAQDAIVRAGNSFAVTVQRGGSTWKPQVTPVGPTPTINSSPTANIQPVTKTSLAAKKPAPKPIGTGHNLAAKPFGAPQVNGEPMVKSIVNKQYNTPVGMYSEESIAETLSAQAEVLAGGVLGVNFMKNEKNYNAANSEVFKMVQEIDSEPRESEPEPPVGAAPVVSPPVSGLRHVSAPETRPTPTTPHEDPFKILPPGQNICADCERLIVGVFVRIKDKNLHVECFKCATCGTSLKNVGYYNINNKLYCDVHAKLVARQHPPAPNLEPITIPPGGKAPAGTISAALSSVTAPAPRPVPGPASAPAPSLAPAPRPVPAPVSPSSPQTIGPMPFHPVGRPQISENGFVTENNLKNILTAMPALAIDDTDSGKVHPTAPSSIMSKAYKSPSSILAPKPFSVPTAPTTSPARPAPEAIVKTLRESVEQEVYPICVSCNKTIRRGPFITALGRIWCPEHFICVNAQCRRPLQDIGFVEEKGDLYCEFCFEQYIAPTCSKCSKKVKGDCLNAIGKQFHPECFLCAYCGKLFGNNPFYLEDGLPYCETDWNELFTTKCFACGFPIEAGDRWVEALNNNYHSQCFNCTSCKKNLEGQNFYAKGGRPFCKAHAR